MGKPLPLSHSIPFRASSVITADRRFRKDWGPLAFQLSSRPRGEGVLLGPATPYSVLVRWRYESATLAGSVRRPRWDSAGGRRVRKEGANQPEPGENPSMSELSFVLGHTPGHPPSLLFSYLVLVDNPPTFPPFPSSLSLKTSKPRLFLPHRRCPSPPQTPKAHTYSHSHSYSVQAHHAQLPQPRNNLSLYPPLPTTPALEIASHAKEKEEERRKRRTKPPILIGRPTRILTPVKSRRYRVGPFVRFQEKHKHNTHNKSSSIVSSSLAPPSPRREKNSCQAVSVQGAF